MAWCRYVWAAVMANCADIFYSLGFYIMITSLFPITLGPSESQLHLLAPGLIWIMLLLAMCLSWPRFWQDAWYEGFLEQCCFMPMPLLYTVTLVSFFQWVKITFPLLIITPWVAMVLGLPYTVFLPLVLSLLVGSLALGAILSMIAALTVSLKRQSLLLVLLSVPLLLPVLIFGVACSMSLLLDLPSAGAWKMLLGLTFCLLACAPPIMTYSLRLNMGGCR